MMKTYRTLSSITSTHWQPTLNKTGQVVEGLDDIHQSISIILSTPLGSDPHRPLFGSKIRDYLDWPVNIIKPYLVRETVEALRRWEKRIDVVTVIIDIDVSVLTIQVQWQIAAGVIQLTEVPYEFTPTPALT